MDVENLCTGCMSVKKAEGLCPVCGWDERPYDVPHYLPQRTVIKNRYFIGKVLGHGGFGITYLAWDMVLNTKLAIKEYFPFGYATRAQNDTRVFVFSDKMKEQYEYGMEKFLEEARVLAQFDEEPVIVSVRDFFRENGTAYIVMTYLEGVSLGKYLEVNGDKVDYRRMMQIIKPVMHALDLVHQAGIIHRDISPDNIFITNSGQVKLLDFGAARNAIGNKDTSLSIILKRGYAPEEQYRSKGNQGPWTDVYALAATAYRMITGKIPPESLDRLKHDTLVPPAKLGIELPTQIEQTLLKALSVKQSGRFQSMQEFMDAIDGVNVSDVTFGLTNTTVVLEDSTKNRKSSFRHALPIVSLALLIIVSIVVFIKLYNPKDKEYGKEPESTATISKDEVNITNSDEENPKETAEAISEQKQTSDFQIDMESIVTGNTSGNLRNYGITAFYKDKIYYSNYSKDEELMVSDINGNNGKCIDSSTRFVKYIQVFDDHIYYTGSLKENYGSQSGIFKLNPNTFEKKLLFKYENGWANNDIKDMQVQNDWIYFLVRNPSDEKFRLHKMKTDGTQDTELIEFPVLEFVVLNDWIFYINSTKNLCKIKTDGTDNSAVYGGEISNLIAENGWLYFLDKTERENYITRIDYSGNDKQIIEGIHANLFTVSGEWIYYSNVDKLVRNSNYLYKTKWDGSDNTKVTDLQVNKVINVIGDWIYFDVHLTSYDLYKVKNDGTQLTIVQ